MKDIIERLRNDTLDDISDTALAAADALERLTAGDVEMPVGYSNRPWDYAGSLWIQSQLKDYGDRRAAAAVMAELERRAVVCQNMKKACGEPDSMQASLNRQMMSCADAIRKGTL